MTAEMLIHDDVDDESTLDEEEALQEEQDDQEIADLQKVVYISLSLSVYLSIYLSVSIRLSLPFTYMFDDLYHVRWCDDPIPFQFQESEMPLEQLLAMYGYNIPTEEGEDEGGEEEGGGADSVEEEERNSPPTATSQVSTNPSSPPPSSSHHEIEMSHKKSSKSKMDSKLSDAIGESALVGSEQLELVHDIIDDHDLAEEVEIEEHLADSPCSPSSSVLGKHPRSEEEERGDDAVYRDVMLSSRTALEGIMIVP